MSEWNDFWEDWSKTITIIFVTAFVLGIGGLSYRRYFAPKHEQIRYDTHKESEAFRDATVRTIRDRRIEYLSLEDELEKAGLRDAILHDAADIKREYIPEDLLDFLDQLEKEQIEFKKNN